MKILYKNNCQSLFRWVLGWIMEWLQLGKLFQSFFDVTLYNLTKSFFMHRPIAIFPRTVLSWNVGSCQDINEASLSLFCILEPKIGQIAFCYSKIKRCSVTSKFSLFFLWWTDILVIGVGDVGQKLNPDVIRYLRSLKIGVEIMPTERACATFNFLNVESRCVAGALIPPSRVIASESDYFKQKMDAALSQDTNTFLTWSL